MPKVIQNNNINRSNPDLSNSGPKSFNFVLRRGLKKTKEFLDLFPFLRILFPRRSSTFSSDNSFRNSISRGKHFRLAALFSSFGLVFLFTLTFSPLQSPTSPTEAATGTAQDSTLTLDVTSASAVVDINVVDSSGTFSSSDQTTSSKNSNIAFSITTNNFSGYTLSIAGTDDTGLMNDEEAENTLSSIPTMLTEAAFSNATNTMYNGMWGYKPSKYNSAVNTNYYPAPTTEESTLDVTTAPNTTANNYTIALGARTDFTKPSTTYKSSNFIITAVTNPINYSIAYNSNTTDTVNNMPATQSTSTSSTSITLSNNTPTRDHYTFNGWCSVKPTTTNGDDVCNGGTVYLAGAVYGIDKTTLNDTTLYAMWNIDKFVQTTQVRYENADGTWGSYSTVETKTVNYGDSYAWNTNQISGFNTAHYQTTSVAEYMVTSAKTNSVDIPRTTYTLTINKNDNYIASVAGAGNYRWGQTVTVSATTTVNGTFTAWNQTAGTSVTLGSSASFSFAMPVSNITLYADGKPKNLGNMQEFTVASCNSLGEGLTYALTDIRDSEEYYFAKLKDGKCWVLDNLRLGSTSTIALTTANTNIASNWTLPAGITSGFNSYNAAQINVAYKNNTTTGYGNGSKKVGVYYNYCAATAGTYCYASGQGTGNASYDICPKNWRMPTGGSSGEYQALYTAYSSNATNFRNALSTPLSGYFDNASQNNLGSYGDFWSSTYYNTNSMFTLDVNSSGVNPTGYDVRYVGFSVRCVLETRTISDIAYMQDVTPTIASNTPIGTSANLVDKRDNETYLVQKLADGNIWMLDNLRLGGTSAITLTPNDTNIASNFTLPAGITSGFNSYTDAQINVAYENTVAPVVYGNGSGKIGAYYNYCAASAGTICMSSNSGTSATYDICPKGWHLPTSGLSGEYQTLFAAYNSSVADFKNALSVPLSGSFRNAAVSYQGERGYFWSSTSFSDIAMHNLRIDSSSVETTDARNRYRGDSVRCVLK